MPRERLTGMLAGAALCLAVAKVLSAETAVAEPNIITVLRAPAGASEIVITTTRRLAGAIHSLTWDGREFINSADHGRQLQSACSFDNTATANAETFNPTEAGSRRDCAGPSSTSRLLESIVHENELRTRTRMAFWLAPGEESEGQLARNTSRLEPLSDGPGEISRPVVLATADGRHAMGVYSPPQAQPDTTGPSYGRWRFKAEQVVKWNCVFRVRSAAGLPTGDYTYRMLVPIGTQAEVTEMLRAWTSRDWR